MATDNFHLLPKITLGVSHIFRKIIIMACDTLNALEQLHLVCKNWKYFIQEDVMFAKCYQEDLANKNLFLTWRYGKLNSTAVISAEEATIPDEHSKKTYRCLKEDNKS